ncbi:MAG TPA: hypothetical protein VFF73_39520 [Planctomycetota bacterium]|nr:hypothetical protein [Planctomycetota bacterium]
MTKTIDTVLLLALPASGKSEVRKYLASLSPEKCKEDLHLGPTVQLDDFPYVHLMRRTDDALVAMKRDRVFFAAPDKSFRRPEDWGTLIELVNGDHEALLARTKVAQGSAGERLLARFDEAGKKVGIAPRLAALPADVRRSVAQTLEEEAAQLEKDLQATHVPLEGKTLVIEFARGGKQGSKMPLPAPYGYAYSIGRLSPRILEKASILYIWVTPEESRRKNKERANPNDPGSILHHGVPEHVMLNEYGCDDMEWLVGQARKPNTVPIEAHGRVYDVPVARFDNRVDRTSFVRGDKKSWRPEDVRALHEGLAAALRTLG